MCIRDSRNGALKLDSIFPLMRANVNANTRNRLRRVQTILKNPTNFVSKLSQANKNAWPKLRGINKGAFVYRILGANSKNNRSNMNTNNVKPTYYFRRTHPLTKQEVWFNNRGRMNNKPTNIQNRPIPPDNWSNNNWKAFESSPLQSINMNNDPNTNFNWHIFMKNTR
jgi:hypothetical protein